MSKASSKSRFTDMSDESGGELAARWWQWALSAPPERSPVRDKTGEFAGWQQPTDLWFLAGTYGGRVERRCRVPMERPIFFPIFNTQHQVRLSAKPMLVEVASVEAGLNGAPLPTREFTSKRFRAAGARRVAWGHWCALDPLAPGQYVLDIKASTTGGFWVDTTYHLTVGVD